MGREVLKNTVLALLAETPGLGEIQLRKALVIIDALNNIFYGKSLTGTKYIKYPYGPVPDDDSWQVISSMIRAGTIYRKEEPIGSWTKHAYYMKSDPDYRMFTDAQMSFIRSAAKFAVKNSAKNLSDLTHDENYANTPMYAEIPLDAIGTMKSCAPKKLTAQEKIMIKNSLLEEQEALQKQLGGAYEDTILSAFV